jgi:hypothetical protein
MKRGIISVIVFGLLLIGSATAAVIHVPDDFPTIQEAIDTAVNGDTIIVRPGIYVENIDFLGKRINVESEGRAHRTVIDGSGLGSVVSFVSGETYKSTLDGFTITNGSAPAGGGIRIENSNAKILHCVIKENLATSGEARGGGLHARNSSPYVLGCMIFRNTAEEGGGIYIEAGSPIITGCTIALNDQIGATGGGGGIHLTEGSTATIANTILWNNTALAGSEIYIGNDSNPSHLDIGYSDVEGGEALVHLDAGCSCTWGTGMLDSDPLFAEAAVDDFHLIAASPCCEAGDNNATGIALKDFEDDGRIAGANVDMGADEFSTHLYFKGNPVPGGNITIRIVGEPSATSVMLGQGPAVKDPPLWTIFGYLRLEQPLLGYWEVGPMPPDGIRILHPTVPAGALPGDELYFQALVGPRVPGSVLTNLLVVTVE